MPLQPARYALLADAVLAGLTFDVLDTPAVWRPTASMSDVVPAGNAPIRAAAEISTVNAPKAATNLALKPAPVVAPVAAAAPVSVYDIWHHGEPEGVAVVLSGAQPLAPEAETLLANMLKAVRLHHLPLAWVGLTGNVGKAQQAQAKKELQAALETYRPQQTLVLGQGVLGVLLERLQGVEGWQAAPVPLDIPGQVGVTFPLELLLQKPLFKSLAWQHLQAWQKGNL